METTGIDNARRGSIVQASQGKQPKGMNAYLATRSIPALIALLATTFVARGEQTNGVNAFVTSNNVFAMDLYAGLKTTPGNLFFSPYSISTCLAMAYAGARGETEKQMAQVLHFSTNQQEVHAAFAKLQKQLNQTQSTNGIELSVANALWAQKGEQFLPGFMDIVTRQYEADVKQADFATEAGPAAREINDWVAGKTRGKIQDIIGPGMLDQRTVLVLVNAVYFKGIWAAQFDKNATTMDPFYVGDGQLVQAPMMGVTTGALYGETAEFQILSLYYRSNEMSMTILLPRERNGLKTVETLLGRPMSTPWSDPFGWRKEVRVFLPKFKFTLEFSLKETLAGMGMKDAFNIEKVDFSGMNSGKDLFISAVAHKASIEVNEEGTEATAATAAITSRGNAILLAPTFRADHPFVFLIRDNRSGSILFMGRVVDPTK
jgi:serine protease inhibitor